MVAIATCLHLLVQLLPGGEPIKVPQPAHQTPQTIVLPKQDADWEEVRRLDLDGDKQPDAVLECQRGRGPLSTYWSTLRLRSLGGVRFLRGGEPMANGAVIGPGDLLATVDTMPLCTVGGSLRVQGKPDEFCGGPWWRKERAALGVVLAGPEGLRLGYIIMGVDGSGALNIYDRQLLKVEPAKIQVAFGPA